MLDVSFACSPGFPIFFVAGDEERHLWVGVDDVGRLRRSIRRPEERDVRVDWEVDFRRHARSLREDGWTHVWGRDHWRLFFTPLPESVERQAAAVLAGEPPAPSDTAVTFETPADRPLGRVWKHIGAPRYSLQMMSLLACGDAVPDVPSTAPHVRQLPKYAQAAEDRLATIERIVADVGAGGWSCVMDGRTPRFFCSVDPDALRGQLDGLRQRTRETVEAWVQADKEQREPRDDGRGPFRLSVPVRDRPDLTTNLTTKPANKGGRSGRTRTVSAGSPD